MNMFLLLLVGAVFGLSSCTVVNVNGEGGRCGPGNPNCTVSRARYIAPYRPQVYYSPQSSRLPFYQQDYGYGGNSYMGNRPCNGGGYNRPDPGRINFNQYHRPWY